MLVSDAQQSYSVICIYKFFFRFFPIVGYYKILNILPCAIQYDLAVYFMFSGGYMLIPNFYFTPLPLSSLVTISFLSVSPFHFCK